MTETGRVVALEADAVWVETLRQGSCGSCAARSGCGHGLLASSGSRPELIRAVLSDAGPRELALHDRVSISIPENRFLAGVTLLYLIPLLCTVGAALAASLLLSGVEDLPRDAWSAGAAMLGLLFSLGWVRWRSGRRAAMGLGLHPVVTARL